MTVRWGLYRNSVTYDDELIKAWKEYKEAKKSYNELKSQTDMRPEEARALAKAAAYSPMFSESSKEHKRKMSELAEARHRLKQKEDALREFFFNEKEYQQYLEDRLYQTINVLKRDMKRSKTGGK